MKTVKLRLHNTLGMSTWLGHLYRHFIALRIPRITVGFDVNAAVFITDDLLQTLDTLSFRISQFEKRASFVWNSVFLSFSGRL